MEYRGLYINLDRSPDRRAVMERQFAALKLPADERAGKFSEAQRRFVRAYADLLETEIRGARGAAAELLEEKERRKKRLDAAKAEIDALNKGAKER